MNEVQGQRELVDRVERPDRNAQVILAFAEVEPVLLCLGASRPAGEQFAGVYHVYRFGELAQAAGP